MGNPGPIPCDGMVAPGSVDWKTVDGSDGQRACREVMGVSIHRVEDASLLLRRHRYCLRL